MCMSYSYVDRYSNAQMTIKSKKNRKIRIASGTSHHIIYCLQVILTAVCEVYTYRTRFVPKDYNLLSFLAAWLATIVLLRLKSGLPSNVFLAKDSLNDVTQITKIQRMAETDLAALPSSCISVFSFVWHKIHWSTMQHSETCDLLPTHLDSNIAFIMSCGAPLIVSETYVDQQ